MWALVGPMFFHAKFHHPGGHRTAYTAKKTKFWIFWVFPKYFFVEKWSLEFSQVSKILHEEGPEPLERVCQIWYSCLKLFGRSGA